MLSKLDVLPEQSIMVDDSPLILETARNLGMATVLVENQDTPKAVADVYKILNGEVVVPFEDIAGPNWKKRAFA